MKKLFSYLVIATLTCIANTSFSQTVNIKYPGSDVIILDSDPFKIIPNKGLLFEDNFKITVPKKNIFDKNNTTTLSYNILLDPANKIVFRGKKTLIYLDKIPYHLTMAM